MSEGSFRSVFAAMAGIFLGGVLVGGGVAGIVRSLHIERDMCADFSEHLEAECKVMDHACWCSDGTGAWVRIGDDE